MLIDTVCRLHPWSLYAVFTTTPTHWATLWDIGLWYFCPPHTTTFWILLITMVFSKIVKLFPLFVREPSYVLYTPVSIVFGHLHGIIKLYAAMTLHVVSNTTPLSLHTRIHIVGSSATTLEQHGCTQYAASQKNNPELYLLTEMTFTDGMG